MSIFKLKRLTAGRKTLVKLAKENRLFSRSKSEVDTYIRTGSREFFERIFKILILGDRCKQDIPHWCDLIAGDLRKSPKQLDSIKMFLPIVDNYKSLPRRYDKEFIDSVREGMNNTRYAKYIKDIIKGNKETRKGLKYSEVYKIAENSGEVPDNETLIQMTKFVVLCLTGQMNIKDHNWYDPEVQTMEVDWNRRVSPTAKMLEEIFKSVLGMDK